MEVKKVADLLENLKGTNKNQKTDKETFKKILSNTKTNENKVNEETNKVNEETSKVASEKKTDKKAEGIKENKDSLVDDASKDDTDSNEIQTDDLLELLQMLSLYASNNDDKASIDIKSFLMKLMNGEADDETSNVSIDNDFLKLISQIANGSLDNTRASIKFDESLVKNIKNLIAEFQISGITSKTNDFSNLQETAKDFKSTIVLEDDMNLVNKLLKGIKETTVEETQTSPKEQVNLSKLSKWLDTHELRDLFKNDTSNNKALGIVNEIKALIKFTSQVQVNLLKQDPNVDVVNLQTLKTDNADKLEATIDSKTQIQTNNQQTSLRQPNIEAIKEETVVVINKQQDIMDTLTEKFKIIRLPDITELKVVLKPKELGEILIKVSLEKGQVNGSIVSDKKEVVNIIQNSLETLKQDLKASNVNLNNISVNISAEDKNNEKGNFFNNNQGNNHKNKREIFSELVDEEIATESEEGVDIIA